MKFASIAFALLLALPLSSRADTLQTEGISGDLDEHHRNPLLTVSTTPGTTAAQILADAKILDNQYTKYPIRFEFYVNGKLQETQIRSPGLPRAVGITVPRSVATLPFNYTVVATLLHPNRQYPTMIEAAVFEQTLTAKLNCTITKTTVKADEPTVEQIFSHENVLVTQPANGTLTLSFSAEDSDNKKITVAGDLTVDSTDKLSGRLTTTESSTPTARSYSGAAVLEEGALTSFTAATADNAISIACQ